MPSQRQPLTPDYTWDTRALRYREAASGRFVSQKAITGALNKVITASQGNVEGITQALMDGNITVAEWQTAMAREIKIMHTASTAAAKGGWAQMAQADWGKTGSLIKRQYEYLNSFAADIASGKQPLNGRVMQRARLYAQASRGSYEEMRRREFSNHGYIEERRVLTAAEHCNGCIEQAKRGWQPIGTLDPIGAEECRTNCQCEFEYRTSETPA